MIDDFIDFDAFVAENGVLNSDTFMSWKRKTNGVIIKVSELDASAGSYISLSALDAYVTKDSAQTITGRKTFPAGSVGSPPITIGTVGIYSVGSILKTSGVFEANSLINVSNLITLNGITYNLPTSVTNDAFLGTGGGGALSWTTRSSLLQQIASQGLVAMTTNKVVPVGTLFPWAGSSAIPDGYLECNGSTFTGSQYQQLAAVLSNTYGPIRNSSGTIISAKGAGSPPAYNATYQYTLPSMNGRVAIGAGTGVDSNGVSRTFALGGQEGEYVHTLTSTEIPVHNHSIAGQTLTSSSSGSHNHFISSVDAISQSAANLSSTQTVALQSTGDADRIYQLKGSLTAATLGLTSTAGAHTHTTDIPATTTGNTGSGASHNITQPYLITRYIIKSIDDVVVNFNLSIGDGITTVSGASFISLTGGGIRVNADGTTLGFTSGGALQVKDASLSPSKLSAGAPSWDTSGRVTIAEPTSPSHGATKNYVDLKIALRGSCQSIVQNLSAPAGFVWVNDDLQLNVSGVSTLNRFGLNDIYANTTLNLPNGETVSSASVLSNTLIVVSSSGAVYASGSNSANKLGTAAGTNLTTLTQVFDSPSPVSFTSILSSGSNSEDTVYALDTSGNLWAAGANNYGQLVSGTLIDTSAETISNSPSVPTNRLKLARSIRSSVTSAVSTGLTVAAISGGIVYVGGYGGNGQAGNGSTVFNNTAWQTVQKSSGGALGNVTDIWGVGEGINSSFIAKTSDGKLWGWGYNGDGRLGTGGLTNLTTASVIWDNSVKGNVSKLIATRHNDSKASVIILNSSKEVWVSGYNGTGKLGIVDGAGSIIPSIITFTKVEATSFDGGWSSGGFSVENIHSGSGNSEKSPTFIIGKASNGSYGLWVSGSNTYSQAGISYPTIIPRFTRVPLPSAIVATIRDISTGEFNTSLLTTANEIFFSGKNSFLIDPAYPNEWNRYSFTKINSI